MSTSYDIRFVSFVGRHWDSNWKERLIQAIAEGPNHTIVAEGTGRSIKEATKALQHRLTLKDNNV